MYYGWMYPAGDPGWPEREPYDGELASDPDTVLALAVVERLRNDRRVGRAQIVVSAQNSVVILEGRSGSAQVRECAGAVAWATPGVFDVCNRLTVREG